MKLVVELHGNLLFDSLFFFFASSNESFHQNAEFFKIDCTIFVLINELKKFVEFGLVNRNTKGFEYIFELFNFHLTRIISIDGTEDSEKVMIMLLVEQQWEHTQDTTKGNSNHTCQNSNPTYPGCLLLSPR